MKFEIRAITSSIDNEAILSNNGTYISCRITPQDGSNPAFMKKIKKLMVKALIESSIGSTGPGFRLWNWSLRNKQII